MNVCGGDEASYKNKLDGNKNENRSAMQRSRYVVHLSQPIEVSRRASHRRDRLPPGSLDFYLVKLLRRPSSLQVAQVAEHEESREYL